jgi:histidinol-phosphatase (PHP family)
MDGIAESGIAIEVSTAGWRKPVGEIYPAQSFLEMCIDAGNPIALSSDAHVPEHVGHEYERAVEWLASLGVTELCVFERRERRLEPIGPT